MNLIATARRKFIHGRIHSFVLPILSLTAFGPPVFAEVVTGSSGGNAAIQFWSVSGTGLHREIGAEPSCDSDSCPTTLDIHGWEVRISPTVDRPGDDTRIVDTHDRYERAMDHLAAGKFENIPMFLSERTPGVAHIAGPVYAASNEMEFFAEVTGWFTGNSFGNHYPSSAHQLWEHSPVMYRIAFEQWRGEREFLNEPATTNEKCLAFIAGN